MQQTAIFIGNEPKCSTNYDNHYNPYFLSIMHVKYPMLEKIDKIGSSNVAFKWANLQACAHINSITISLNSIWNWHLNFELDSKNKETKYWWLAYKYWLKVTWQITNTFKHKKSNVSQYSEVGITLRKFKLYSGVADPCIDFYIMSTI